MKFRDILTAVVLMLAQMGSTVKKVSNNADLRQEEPS
jgi:hypothetical protein